MKQYHWTGLLIGFCVFFALTFSVTTAFAQPPRHGPAQLIPLHTPVVPDEVILITVQCGTGRVEIYPDGRAVFTKGCKPNKGAKAFWEAVASQAKGSCGQIKKGK